MRLVTYQDVATKETRVGALLETAAVVDLTQPLAPNATTMRHMLARCSKHDVAAAVAAKANTLPPEKVRLLAPINDPQKVICVGMNYRDHCIEQDVPIPAVPLLFGKFASAIAASGDPIPYDVRETAELDPEVELAIVIGKGGRRIDVADAPAHIAGFTVANDVSARDLQLKSNGGQWLLGKCGDGYAPIGPAIVTADELPTPLHLDVSCVVNGVVMQRSNTRELVHDPASIVAYASRFMSLVPGDIILTGTPGGVGVFRKPPVFLKDGDVVTCEIEHIGQISNRVVEVGGRAKL